MSRRERKIEKRERDRQRQVDLAAATIAAGYLREAIARLDPADTDVEMRGKVLAVVAWWRTTYNLATGTTSRVDL